MSVPGGVGVNRRVEFHTLEVSQFFMLSPNEGKEKKEKRDGSGVESCTNRIVFGLENFSV
jgi:hypothetical protein